MILLVTNILSALIRFAPDPVVTKWLDTQFSGDIWTTAISIFEIRYGVSRMAAGSKRTAFTAAFETFISDDLAGRIAPLDYLAADAAGILDATRQAAGLNIEVRDMLIAGIAISRRATIATCNVRHFSDIQIPVINPWSD